MPWARWFAAGWPGRRRRAGVGVGAAWMRTCHKDHERQSRRDLPDLKVFDRLAGTRNTASATVDLGACCRGIGHADAPTRGGGG